MSAALFICTLFNITKLVQTLSINQINQSNQTLLLLLFGTVIESQLIKWDYTNPSQIRVCMFVLGTRDTGLPLI